MAKSVELNPRNLLGISRIEYRWGKSLKVFDEINEIDLGIKEPIMRALMQNGAAAAEAFATILALASGKKLDAAEVDRDHSFPRHTQCTTIWFLKGR